MKSAMSITILALVSLITMPVGAEELKEYRNIDIKNIDKIRVDMEKINPVVVGMCILKGEQNLNIETYKGDDLKINLSGSITTNKEKSKPRLRVKKNGNILDIIVDTEQSPFYGKLKRTAKIYLDIIIPESYKGSLDFSATSAYVTAKSLNLSNLEGTLTSGTMKVSQINCNEAKLQSTSGGIEVFNLKAPKTNISASSGTIEAKGIKTDTIDIGTTSGSIILSGIDTKDIKMKSSSGRINVDNLVCSKGTIGATSGSITIERSQGAFYINTSSGNIKADISKVLGDSSFETTSGSINLDLSDNASFKLEANTQSGSIKCDFPITLEQKNNNNSKKLYGRVSDGGPTLKLQASSGSIKIK